MPGGLLIACLALAAPVWADAPPPDAGAAILRDARGKATPLLALAQAHEATVVIFYARTCPCFAAHVERLRKLAAALKPRGVAFLVVDSERHAAGEPPPPAEIAPGLPVLRDEGGALARRWGALYATESFVLDSTGRVRYRGGIDSDRKYLRPDTTPYLRDALQKLLVGQAPAFTTSKALGCMLRLR